MCTKHLECKEKDNFKILEGIEIKPSKAPVSTSKKIKLVNALMSISPMKLMDMDTRKWQRYMKNLNKTLKSNCGNVQVIELECNKDGDHSDYYSESEIDGHRSSENFRVFQPNNKTQIVIDKVTREILFCLPDQRAWSLKDQEAFKNCLIKRLKYQPNFINKNAKRRKTTASKWAMIGMKLG